MASKAQAGGRPWAKSLFESTFGIDHGPTAIAYPNAFRWGTAWASTTFSARFSVDLGPMRAAVGEVGTIAQQIRDLLPSLPAKKGPLSTPVSFVYIADAARRDLRGMGRIFDGALANMSALANMPVGIGPLPVLSSAGGLGPHSTIIHKDQTIQVNGAGDPRSVATEVVRLLVRGNALCSYRNSSVPDAPAGSSRKMTTWARRGCAAPARKQRPIACPFVGPSAEARAAVRRWWR